MKPIQATLAAVAVALALAVPTAGQAQTEPPSWLLKYISWWANVGQNPPNIQEPTVIALHGWFPYECGQVTGIHVVDPGHVAFTLRPGGSCTDTTRQWVAGFDLGLLPFGTHTLSVQRTFVAATGDSITEEASFDFEVVDLNAEPPPPPPSPQPGPGWLFPYLAGWYPIPAQPNALEPTTAVLYGQFPYDCGEIADARVVDPGHIEFTMRPGPACSDTTRRWSHAFDLGLLPEGYHVVHVTRRFVSPDSDVVAEGDFGFPVWPAPGTPPPPEPPGPPDYPSLYVRCLSGWYTRMPPTTHAPTTLVLWGWFPYLCGEVADATVLAPDHVSLTLRPGSACRDTAATWSQSFELGFLPAGANPVKITLDVEHDPAAVAALREATITLYVDDQEVSASAPNPFVTDTRFSVVTGLNTRVDVAIYDLHGRRVATLFRGWMSGNREFRWNGRRDDGSRAAIGIYFSRVAFSNRVVTRKLVMLPR